MKRETFWFLVIVAIVGLLFYNMVAIVEGWPLIPAFLFKLFGG